MVQLNKFMPHTLVKEGRIGFHGYAIGALGILREERGVQKTERRLPLINSELRRVRRAFNKARKDLEKISKRLEEIPGAHKGDMEEASAVLGSHKLTLEDPVFKKEIEEKIEDGASAEAAVRKTSQNYMRQMQKYQKRGMRDKTRDIEDTQMRLEAYLGSHVPFVLPEDAEIVWADRLRPQQVLELKHRGIKGVVLRKATGTSHELILLRALQIPTLYRCEYRPRLGPDETVTGILDAATGRLIVRPADGTLSEYREKLSQFRQREKALAKLPAQSYTTDNTRIHVMLNLELVEELDLVNFNLVDGVGLFRSEFLLMRHRDTAAAAPWKPVPAEEQAAIYRRLLLAFPNQEVYIRLFDLGGDKELVRGRRQQRRADFLGHRSIRLLLENRSLLRSQLRGLLIAASAPGCEPKVTLPMVTIVEEVQSVEKIMREEADKMGVDPLPLGVMIETPASIDLMPFLNKLVDFYSIGTNDLLQYLTASRRTDAGLRHIYDPLHESLFASLARIAKHGKNKPISVCGEIASDPQFLPLLIGLGFRRISVAPSSVYPVKLLLEKLSRETGERWVREIRKLPSRKERHNRLQALYDEFLDQAGFSDFDRQLYLDIAR